MLLRWLISVANAPTGSPYTPGPELGALTQLEIRRTALARAREMIDYRTFRDMMAESAPDHEPSSKTTRIFFATMQNKLYLHVVGTTAEEIKQARNMVTWPASRRVSPSPARRTRPARWRRTISPNRSCGSWIGLSVGCASAPRTSRMTI
ncbi:hypothetical protein [Streptomyces chartreusis]|uniref:hypothetical protein n=1 Tax=Streptomyces chartreusis TaxID=1969 RepID=UPI0036D8B7A0